MRRKISRGSASPNCLWIFRFPPGSRLNSVVETFRCSSGVFTTTVTHAAHLQASSGLLLTLLVFCNFVCLLLLVWGGGAKVMIHVGREHDTSKGSAVLEVGGSNKRRHWENKCLHKSDLNYRISWTTSHYFFIPLWCRSAAFPVNFFFSPTRGRISHKVQKPNKRKPKCKEETTRKLCALSSLSDGRSTLISCSDTSQ